MKKISRRKFISFAAISALGFPLSINASQDKKNNEKFDEYYDVIVVGSGISAHICATYLAKNKINVLMIEKMDRIGGNSALSQQDFAVMGSDLQKKENIQDSVELFLKDLNKAGGGYNHKEQSLRLIKYSNEAYEFAKSCGIKYSDKLKFLGGHSVPRTIQTIGGGGKAIQTIHNTFLKEGGKFKKETKCDEIIKNDKGEVVGIEVRENYRFDRNLKNDDRENKTGIKKRYCARIAVVFATGGFSRDVEYRSIENPRLKRAYTPSNLGQTAGALKTMAKAGANPVQVSLSRFSFGIPTEDLIYGIIVDKNAQRFMNEDGDRQVLSNKILAHMDNLETDIYPIVIFDSNGFSNSHDPRRMQSFISSGKMFRFENLEELSNFFDLDLNELKKTINEYEQGLSNQKDKFEKDLSKSKNSGINKAPFYAMKAMPSLSYTPGGIFIDTNMKVLSIENNQPIKNLYAIGEATGGVHGASRLTSCSIPDCMTSGLLCAKNIISEKLI
ncbi:flavocytochrome c [Campylobacter novaezeelandiae]|uniref:flavocytochrome c n=1 Tax=Campylobacter novaezeelandiae TaxID=2267891 RepID=UPI0010372C9E|nr:flavocytochrome c [Campylobacter novaezeelandiae]TBR79468.1 flavocytochrome c [Campylobacter novaezeelandiae]